MARQLTSRFEEALTFAAQLHSKQTRKGTTIPYIAHLLAVASLVITHGGDEDEAIAALLHDAVEDCGPHTRDIIRRRFSEQIMSIVEGCTDTDVTPKPAWRERKERYLNHLGVASPSVQLVAAADKLDNVRAIVSDFREIGPTIWERFNAGKQDQLWFYRGCVSALQHGGRNSIVLELDRAVREMEQL